MNESKIAKVNPCVESEMETCGHCKFWDGSKWIMNKYGEGCGLCKLDGQITFCEHKCPFASPPEGEYYK